jgi:chromatin modification-related protein VID21
MAHDTPSVLPYGSPMSEALSSPSPLPLDAEIDDVAPPEEGSPEPGGSRPPSPDTAMEVIEDVSVEVPDEEPPPPSQADPDRLEDVSPLPSSTLSEEPVADTGADALLAEDLSDVFEETEQMMVSVTPSEAGPTQLVIEYGDDSRSEGSTCPVTTEQVTVQEDMDVDVVGESRAEADEPVLLTPERRSQSAVPPSPSPQASQTEGHTSPPPPPPPPAQPFFAPLALPPSAFILPPRPSTEVFIPATLAPIGASPQYSLGVATAEPRSLTTNEWLNPEFSLNRNYTLPFAKSLPLDQQRRLKLGKNLRKKEKEKDKVPESRKDGIDDWTPLGLNKWGVSIRANPLWKRVSRATKTMSTRDWNVRILSCPKLCDSERHLGGLHGVAPHSSVGAHRTAQRNRQMELSAAQEAAGTRDCIQDALGLSLR